MMVEACQSGFRVGAGVNNIYLIEYVRKVYCFLYFEAFPNVVIDNIFNALILQQD